MVWWWFGVRRNSNTAHSRRICWTGRSTASRGSETLVPVKAYNYKDTASGDHGCSFSDTVAALSCSVRPASRQGGLFCLFTPPACALYAIARTKTWAFFDEQVVRRSTCEGLFSKDSWPTCDQIDTALIDELSSAITDTDPPFLFPLQH